MSPYTLTHWFLGKILCRFIRLCSKSLHEYVPKEQILDGVRRQCHGNKNRPSSMAQPLADRLPSLHSTSLRVWGSKVSGTCSPRFQMLQIVHLTGDSPHGRVSLSTQPYAFYILYPCEWQIKTQQVYLTNASAFSTSYIFFSKFFFCLFVCFKNLWMCSNIHKRNVLKKSKE